MSDVIARINIADLAISQQPVPPIAAIFAHQGVRTVKLLQLSPAVPLATADAMFASHGYVMEAGLVRRVEFPATLAPQSAEAPLEKALGPLWVRLDALEGYRFVEIIGDRLTALDREARGQSAR